MKTVNSVPLSIPTLTRLGEVRPSDPRYVAPVLATAHLSNRGQC